MDGNKPPEPGQDSGVNPVSIVGSSSNRSDFPVFQKLTEQPLAGW